MVAGLPNLHEPFSGRIEKPCLQIILYYQKISSVFIAQAALIYP
jgi:hypothetical protein